MTCPPWRMASPMAWWRRRWIEPRLALERNSVRMSMVPTWGSGRSMTRRGMSMRRYSPSRARCQLSSDGVAEPRTRGTFSWAARRMATSRAW